MNEIKIWAQMFFEDGSVTEGKRIPAETLDDIKNIATIGNSFLESTNRTEGFLLLWGAGSICAYNITSPSEASDSLALEPYSDPSLPHTNPSDHA